VAVAIARPAVLREVATQLPPGQDRIALLDCNGTIVAVNNNWMDFAERAGAPLNLVGPGVNYLEVCCNASSSSVDARAVLSGIRAVLNGELPSFRMDYTSQTTSGPASYRMSVTFIPYSEVRAVVAHVDISELRVSSDRKLQRLQHLNRDLINAQEEERQRVSQEIHDDIGSRIALLAFSIRNIMGRRSKNSSSNQAVNQVIRDLTDLSNATRDLSHRLQPPVLRYAGISAALKQLCDEFEKVLRIRINLVVPQEFPRLPENVELSMFRISQECLHNIAKHSGADRASVVLERTSSQIQLTVADTGRGFVTADAIQNGGLGLANMEQRARCIGARLEVNSSPGSGTEVHVVIPLQEDPGCYHEQAGNARAGYGCASNPNRDHFGAYRHPHPNASDVGL
jgi:two-component system, NarL family, sensor kinase